jgi:hypothetical protein
LAAYSAISALKYSSSNVIPSDGQHAAPKLQEITVSLLTR